MKVLVLGGTGAIGIHLVRLLSENGAETVITTREERKSERIVKYIEGNAHDIKFLQSILQEHWDAIIDFMVYTTSDFKERVKLLLDNTSQYVFLSSARVYADSEQAITETSPLLLDVSKDKEFLSTDEYSLVKARQEDILKKSGKTNWTIIRPYITYSENRLQLGVLEKEEWLYRALHGRTVVFSEDIYAKTTTLTYGLDVSKGIVAITGNPGALGETFHITTEKSLKWEDVLTIYLEVLEKHLGYRPKVSLQNIEQFSEWKLAKYQILYDRFYDRQFDNSKISKYIDTKNFVRTESGLKTCLEEFFKNPDFRNINWKAEALKDRQIKEYTPLKEIKGLKQKLKYLIFRYFKGKKL